MQRGQILKHHGAWLLRFYDTELVNGKPVRVRRAKRLAPISPEFPTKRSVLTLAEDVLGPINRATQTPDSSMLVTDFIELRYLPHVQKNLRPSTYKDYKRDIFEKHLVQRLGKLRLRDFRTVNGQRLLASIHEANPNIGHKTLLRVKSFLSGAFKHAKREGILDGLNPMVDVSAPGRPRKFKAPVYSLSEIMNLLQAVMPDSELNTAGLAIAVAAFTGLRLSELRGLRWEDWRGDTLMVARSVWRTHVNEPKTEGSEATVPVLPPIQKMLEQYRESCRAEHARETNGGGYIFAGERRGTPLNLANLTRRVDISGYRNVQREE